MSLNLNWGLRPFPEDAIAIWGARGIMQNEYLDLPYDRQSFVAPDLSESEQEKFINWINTKALPELRRHIIRKHWRGDTTQIFLFEEQPFRCKASSNASYGYCYITCWQKKAASQQ